MTSDAHDVAADARNDNDARVTIVTGRIEWIESRTGHIDFFARTDCGHLSNIMIAHFK